MGSSSDEKEEPSALSESEESENELDVAPKLENFAEQVSDYSISDQVNKFFFISYQLSVSDSFFRIPMLKLQLRNQTNKPHQNFKILTF